MKKKYYLFLFFFCAFIATPHPCIGEEAKSASVAHPSPNRYFFTFQVQAFADKEQAYRLEKNFSDKGYHAYVTETVDKNGKTLYQVRIGKYKTRSEVEEAARLFYQKENVPYWITVKQAQDSSPPSTTIYPAEPPPSSQPEATESEKTPTAESNGSEIDKVPDEEKYLLFEDAPAGEAPAKSSSLPAERPQQKSDAQESTSWPQKVSRIYIYRGSRGHLVITNALKKIPEESRDAIESISVFPAKFISFNKRKKIISLEIDGEEELVQLAGIEFRPSDAARSANGYCDKNLKAVPLRVKYVPRNKKDRNKPVLATLYFKNGVSINREILRQGIAAFDPATVPDDQKQQFMEAEASAKKDLAGIWAQSVQQ